MTAPVSMQSTNSFQSQNPPAAFGLWGNDKKNQQLKAGHFVVNPPVIHPHSFYDEIKVDRAFYRELINPKSKAFYYKPAAMKTEKPKKTFKKILTWAVVIGAGILAFTKRNLIKTFLSNTYDKIKNHIKRK